MKKLSRRQVALGLGAVGTGAILSPLLSEKSKVSAVLPKPYPTCTVSTEQPEGPFYFEAKLIRKDITEGLPGATLHLKLKIVDGEQCDPVWDAVVDIWSCDAMGFYSGYETVYTDDGRIKEHYGNPRDNEKHIDNRRPSFHQEPINEKTFLRGAQVSDTNGEVEFKTIYPGWYPGRATHIHVKVYLDGGEVFTSQIYFPEETNEIVYNEGVYANKKEGRVRNNNDRLFNQGGNGPVVEITRVEDGYVGTWTCGIQR